MDNFFTKDGGIVLNCTETKVYFNSYIEGLALDHLLSLVFKENTVARSCMTYTRDSNKNLKGILSTAFPITYRINNIEGVFNHEIGTHYLRKYNE